MLNVQLVLTFVFDIESKSYNSFPHFLIQIQLGVMNMFIGVQRESKTINLVASCPRRKRLRITSLSDKFAPAQILQRVSLWTDLVMAWGLLYPPLALIGLLYVMLETWCYKKAATCFAFEHAEEDEVCQVPRHVLIFWMMVASIFATLHFVSAMPAEPTMAHLAVLASALALSWLAGFCWKAHKSDVDARRQADEDDKGEEAIELHAVAEEPA